MGKVSEQIAIGICQDHNVLYDESCPDCDAVTQPKSVEEPYEVVKKYWRDKALASVNDTLISMGFMRKNTIHAIIDISNDIVDDLIEKKLLKWS